MGKGEIIADLGDGAYTVKVKLERGRYLAKLALIDKKISTYTAIVATQTDEIIIGLWNVRIAQLQAFRDWMEKVFATDPICELWCADYTGELSGEVGLIEVPGQRQYQNVHPGYDGAAAYSAARDGKLTPAVGTTAAGTFYNLAVQPGWQKFKPTFRYATITSIDYDNDKCNVALEGATSTIKGIDVNLYNVLENVPIEYMDCNSAAFEEGDSVIVKFENQDWNNPKVIGFKEEPKPCGCRYIYIKLKDIVYYEHRVTVFDVIKNTVATVPGVVFPCNDDDPNLLKWLGSLENITTEAQELFTSVPVAKDEVPSGSFVPETSDIIDWDSGLKPYFPLTDQCLFTFEDNSHKVGATEMLPGALGYVDCLADHYREHHLEMSHIHFKCEIPHAINGFVYKNANGVGNWSGAYSASLVSERTCHFDFSAYADDGDTLPYNVGCGGPEFLDEAYGIITFKNPLGEFQYDFAFEVSDDPYCWFCSFLYFPGCKGSGEMDQESIAFLGGVTDYRIIQHISTGKPDYYGTLHLTSYIPPYPTEIQYHKFCGGVGLQIYLYNHSQFDENHEYHINRVTYAELCWGPSRYVILQNSQIGEHAFAPEHYKTPIFTVNAGYLKGAMWDKSDFINETERKTALESALTALYEATRSDAEASGLLEQFPMNLSMVVQFFAEIYHS